MADVKSLVKALKDMAVTQYGKGEPYRDALASALKGDMGGVNQSLSKSDLTPMDFAMSFAPMGITAYHGSPYNFDKFNPAKIGTGEGAQAYGHGLYFAESPEVAKSYQDVLGIQKTSMSQMANDNLSNYNIAPSNIKHLHQVATDKTIPIERAAKVIKNANAALRNAPDEVLSNLVSNFREQSKGNLYKVDIADESIPKMLDWDKPLNQQSQEIQPAINATLEKIKKLGFTPNPNEMTGKGLYTSYQQYRGNQPDFASEGLNELGITGIRYLDQGSRGVGKGTSNYVVFNPNTIKILEKN